MTKLIKSSKAVSELQAIAKDFIKAVKTERRNLFGDVRLFFTESQVGEGIIGEHRIQGDYGSFKEYQQVMVHTVIIYQSRAFGVRKTKAGLLKLIVAYHPAKGEDYMIEVVDGKIEIYLPIKLKSTYPLMLEIINQVRQKLSAAFTIEIIEPRIWNF